MRIKTYNLINLMVLT